MISQWTELRDRVKASVNLKELAEQYTPLTPVGHNVWSGHCPHPDHHDRTPSFRVFKNKNGTWSFRCFGCQGLHEKKGQNGNYGSDCFAFLQWMSDYTGSPKVLTFMDALLELAERQGYEIPYKDKDSELLLKRNREKCRLAQGNLLPMVKRYLFNRGLDTDDISLWQIGAWPYREQGQTVLRITFPLFNRQKDIVGFSSRILKDSADIPKYKNSKSSVVFQKRSYLYGYHLLDTTCHDIRITEGQFDVILAVKYGLKNVVATLGTSFTEEHAVQIKSRNMIPTFVYDNDNAGIAATERALSICQEKELSAKVCVLPREQDLADLAVSLKEKLPLWIMSHSVPAWQYRLSDIAVQYEARLQELRRSILPDIRSAVPAAQEDKILMKTFVKERFGITI